MGGRRFTFKVLYHFLPYQYFYAVFCLRLSVHFSDAMNFVLAVKPTADNGCEKCEIVHH